AAAVTAISPVGTTIPVTGNHCVTVTVDGEPITPGTVPAAVSAAVTGAPTQFTTAVAHGLATNDFVVLDGGTGNWVRLNGGRLIFPGWQITVIDSTHFSIPFDSTFGFGALTGS